MCRGVLHEDHNHPIWKTNNRAAFVSQSQQPVLSNEELFPVYLETMDNADYHFIMAWRIRRSKKRARNAMRNQNQYNKRKRYQERKRKRNERKRIRAENLRQANRYLS
tara:strand:- start:85 stop:408 length:324 start_codon:yes stop_codon:yes gene_type:complete